MGDSVRPQPKCMPALHIHVHLRGNAGLPERRIVDERVLDRIHRIILRLQQERGRRPAGDLNVGIQREVSLADCQMSRIERHREIRAAALSVGGVHGGYRRFSKCVLIAATMCPPAEKPSTPILCGSICHCAAWKRTSPTVLCASSNAVRQSRYGPDLRARHAVFQQHARDSPGRQPITDFRAFKIDGQNVVASAGEHDDRNARVVAPWRIDRHRGLRDAVDIDPRLAGNQLWFTSGVHHRPGDLGPLDRLRIRDHTRPDRHLRMARRWLPGGLPRAQRRVSGGDGQKSQQSDSHSVPNFHCGRAWLFGTVFATGQLGLRLMLERFSTLTRLSAASGSKTRAPALYRE